ncbi:hypothetical protein [Rhizobium rhizosphaerae]|uniref:hypothetical protein n=1 Tax=Xaviernesmea rhizosphaerae TaxID=1672749 RepID=UPI000B0E64C8|nr:hypothetical protein [Xaviernesmea rhizosphaerae]
MTISSYNQFGGGGINNQKMAIIGAAVNAFEKSIPFALPRISEMDQLNKNYEKYDYAEIFDESIILSILRDHKVEIVPFSDAAEFDISYEDCFWKTFHLFESRAFLEDNDRGRLISGLVRSFVPRAIESAPFLRLNEAIHNRDGEILFCQFRIENDWIVHCANEIVKVRSPFEELYVDYMSIVFKIANTFPKVRNLFVCADELSMPISKNFLKENVWKTFGLRILFKSDFLGLDSSEYFRPNEQSLIDMALCMDGNDFVGTTRSTFSNMVSLQRYCSKPAVGRAFVYNHRSIFLKQRRDNGASAALEQAVEVNGRELIINESELARLVDGDVNRVLQLRQNAHFSFDSMVENGDFFEISNAKMDNYMSVPGVLFIRKNNAIIL